MKSMNAACVTVIVPVYNAAPWIGACIDSILGQTSEADEIILVDDGSSDGSAEICRRFAERHAGVRFISQEHKGPSEARNAGVSAASSEYVVFIDSDDVVHPAMLAAFRHIQHLHPDADIICAPMCEFEADVMPPVKAANAGDARLCVMGGEDYLEKMLYQTHYALGVTSSVCGKMFRTELWREAAFEKGIIYEDLEGMARISMLAQRIVCMSAELYYYRHTPGSITTTFLPRRMDAVRVAEKILRDNSGNPRLASAARNRLFSASFNMLLLMGFHGAWREMDVEKGECKGHIRALRRGVLWSRRSRVRDRIGALMAYFPGVGLMCRPWMAKKILKR